MTPTVSDGFAAAETAAADVSDPSSGPDSPGTRRARVARARVAATERDDKGPSRWRLLVSDWRGAWWWTATPDAPAEVLARRVPTPDDVPDGSAFLRYAWAVWLHAVAIPATYALTPVARLARPLLLRQLIFGLVWVLQHPARSALAALVTVPLGFMWIAF